MRNLASFAILAATLVAAPRASALGDAPAQSTDAPASGAATGAPGAGAPAAAPAAPEKVDPSLPPEAFLRQANANDAVEIALGRLAMSNGAAAQVKDYGHRMATNHTAIQVLVSKAAKKKELTLPAEMSAEDQATVERLRGLQGAEFDKAYGWVVSDRSKKALDMFRWQYDNCQDPELKAFAMGTLPIIVTHQRLGEAMHQDINKDEIRAEADRKAAEAKAAEQKRAEDAAAQAAANSKKKPASTPPKKPKKPLGVP